MFLGLENPNLTLWGGILLVEGITNQTDGQ